MYIEKNGIRSWSDLREHITYSLHKTKHGLIAYTEWNLNRFLMSRNMGLILFRVLNIHDQTMLDVRPQIVLM